MSDKITRGEKIDDQEAAKSGKLGILLTLAPGDSVEGQFWHGGTTQCPYCGNIGFTAALNTDFWVNVVCGRCGMVFSAHG
jgi:hypothetical protein